MNPYWYVNVEGAIIKDRYYLMIVRGEQETHAPGVLTLPGGTVENAGNTNNILEETLSREIAEEVGVEIHDEIEYIESNAFIADDGEPVVDIVFLCQYKGGTPRISDPGEVAAIQWMTAQEVFEHPKAPEWTRRSIERSEKKRIEKQW
ncbi:NUDIX domain-containing protein [Candidatus Poribacteria bacterium]|nr:NUDIX domain-containing protein [Candidatus Poribacteria bacterium]